MQSEIQHEQNRSNSPQHRRPWIAIIPLAMTGFLFLVITVNFTIKFFANQGNDPQGYGIAIAILSVLSILTFFACFKLYQGPDPNARTTFPLWFTRGFGIFMLIASTLAYLDNKVNGAMYAKGLLLFFGIAITGDVVNFTNPQSKNPDSHR